MMTRTPPHVVIVGSGPIGAAFARTLLEQVADLRVTMLELGPQLTPVAGENLRNVADPDAKRVAQERAQGPMQDAERSQSALPSGTGVAGTYASRRGTHLIDFGGPGSGHAAEFPAAAVATNVGGQGAHWTCATPAPAFTELIPFIPEDEWSALLSRAEALLGTTHEAFRDSPVGEALVAAVTRAWGDDLPEGYRPSQLPVAMTERADGTGYWSGVDTVLGPLIAAGSEENRRFTLRAETQARAVLHDGGRVSGVRIRDVRSGAEEELAADVVIVAADALRTPQLLWASGIRPRALGHYLSDHPTVFSVVRLEADKLAGLADLDALRSSRRERIERMSREHFDPVLAVARVPFSEPAHPFSNQVMYMDRPAIAVDDDSIDDSLGYANVGYGIRKPSAYENAVTFDDDELDWAGMPNMTIHYSVTDADRQAIEEAKAAQLRTAAALGSFAPGGEPTAMPPGASLHYKGTMRLGESDDGTSVADPFSRVWGFENLLIGGNGTIPTATVVNPTLTSVAIALRAADALVRSLETESPESAADQDADADPHASLSASESAAVMGA